MRPKRLLRFCLALVSASACILFLPDRSDAQVNVCNDSSAPRKLTVAYRGSADEGWISKGWMPLEPHRCVVLLEGTPTPRPYFVRVQGDNGGFGGDAKFCVLNHHPFRVTHAEVFNQKDVDDCLRPTGLVTKGTPLKGIVLGFARVDRDTDTTVHVDDTDLYVAPAHR